MERTKNYERVSNDQNRKKMESENDFGTRKTIIVFAIVAGCFAVLWPKIFYPMLNTSVNTVHTNLDGSVCCDLIFEPDVNAVDILQEMCKNILKHHQVDPRIREFLQTNKLSPQSASFCREQVLIRCGIDLSSFLAEKERLGKSYKQVLEEIRSFNSSFCLKVNFGVPLSRLGIPHLIRYHVLMPHTPIRQERRLPPHAGGLHPAMRERGRAIPSSHIVPKVDGRPDHMVVQKMRPPMGGAGRVVPPPSGGGSMGIILPLYTVGILLFFVYTISKILRKNSNNQIYAEYSHPEAEREFRDRVFNPEVLSSAITGMSYRKESSPVPSKRVSTIDELKQQDPGEIEVDQLIQRLADTEAAMERIVVQMGNLSRNVAQNTSLQPETQSECTDKICCNIGEREFENTESERDCSSPTVKVLGMEMTASCEKGQKMSRPSTPVFCHSPSNMEREKTPPKPIYLEGSLPPQCELLVTDSETQAENSLESGEAPVVLSGKMTLSLISLDQNIADVGKRNVEYEQSKLTKNSKPEMLLPINGMDNNNDEDSQTDIRTDKNLDYNIDSEINVNTCRQTEDNEDNIKNLKIEKNIHKLHCKLNNSDTNELNNDEKRKNLNSDDNNGAEEYEDNQINETKMKEQQVSDDDEYEDEIKEKQE